MRNLRKNPAIFRCPFISSCARLVTSQHLFCGIRAVPTVITQKVCPIRHAVNFEGTCHVVCPFVRMFAFYNYYNSLFPDWAV